MAARKIALLIGNGRFGAESGFAALRCPANDVDGLARLLAEEQHGGFEVRTLVDKTQREIQLALLEVLHTSAQFDDRVIVYYSGHGSPDEDGNLFLAASDSTKATLDATGLGVEYVGRRIRNSKSQQVALILDCCYSGSVERLFTKGEVSDQVRTALTPKEHTGSGMYTLTASTSTQLAEEKEGDEYSLLTKHILGGILDGYADHDDDGIVTMHELTVYVQEALKAEGSRQEPLGYMQRAGGGEMEFARTGRPAMAARRKEVQAAISRAELTFYVPEDVVECVRRLVSQRALEQSGEPARRRLRELHRLIGDSAGFVRKLHELAAAEAALRNTPAVDEVKPFRAEVEKPKVHVEPRPEPVVIGPEPVTGAPVVRQTRDHTWIVRYVLWGSTLTLICMGLYGCFKLMVGTSHPPTTTSSETRPTTPDTSSGNQGMENADAPTKMAPAKKGGKLPAANAPPMQANAPPAYNVQPKGPVRVSSGVMAGNLLSRTDPVYPPVANAAGIHGSVVLHALISTTGTVEQLAVISGPEMFRNSALEAVRSWRYKPYLLNGEAMEVDTTVTVNFELDNQSPPRDKSKY